VSRLKGTVTAIDLAGTLDGEYSVSCRRPLVGRAPCSTRSVRSRARAARV